ncbi:MAG: ferredoxin [Candidatus Pacebacteria bacterium]|nr:ferredoxin [Candidatus Paceibacterota bacterium]
MIKIIHHRDRCIGCGACVYSCPDNWERSDDGLVTLKKSIFNPEEKGYELEVSEVGCNQDAVDVCPVQCIIISN